VSRDNGVNADTDGEMTSSYKAGAADKRHDVRSMFRLGRRRGAEANEAEANDESDGGGGLDVTRSQRDGTDRRAFGFRLGRRSAYDSFLMNYDDDNDDND